MSNLTIKPDEIIFQPPTQTTICFGSNGGLFSISDSINEWLKEHPEARIIQMIQTDKCVLCLYEYSEVVLKSE